ncbi:MAG: glycosyltransferase family 4 protein [Candidatus Methanoperedens sp.]|nr:glycosyltransferase family 4 protein [Candidatus Methanoperedens sp.]
MKIAIVAPSVWYRIAPPHESKYGGAEKIVYWICEKLVEWGHDVTLFATGDSITSAKLVPTYPCSVLGQDIKNGKDSKISISWNDINDNFLGLRKALEVEEKFEVIHSHVYGDPLVTSSLNGSGVQVLSTIHNSMSAKDMGWENIMLYRSARNRKHHRFVAISKSQTIHDDAGLSYKDIVYNGIDLSSYKTGRRLKRKNDTLLCLSRIDPQKGIEFAIDAAQEAGMKLIIAGRKHPGKEEEFFKDRIEPRLQKGVLEYAGEVSNEEKIKLLSVTTGVIFPSFWREPFGLVPVEAGACSTPLIGFECGAIPEIVINGKTGFLAQPRNNSGKPNIKGLVEAIKRIDQIDPTDCFDHVKKNFTADIMVENYLNIYKELSDKTMDTDTAKPSTWDQSNMHENFPIEVY